MNPATRPAQMPANCSSTGGARSPPAGVSICATSLTTLCAATRAPHCPTRLRCGFGFPNASGGRFCKCCNCQPIQVTAALPRLVLGRRGPGGSGHQPPKVSLLPGAHQRCSDTFAVRPLDCEAVGAVLKI